MKGPGIGINKLYMEEENEVNTAQMKILKFHFLHFSHLYCQLEE